ncbi:MAG: oxygenase MpaB family protein [Acidimicrobiales bacterium]
MRDPTWPFADSASPPDPSEPLARVLKLGADLAHVPFRIMSGFALPFRADIERTVRRSFGIAQEPRPRANDPNDAFVDPRSVVRRVHSDLGPMMIGGFAALMLQALHPLAMAGVAEHSQYEADPIGRLRRTADFVGTTTFGTMEEAREAIARVKAIHQRVHGVAPDGRSYSANDPELLTWVHSAEVYCFLAANQRFGAQALSRSECDSYYRDWAHVALELGARWVPTDSEEMEAYLLRIRRDLCGGPQAISARDFLIRGVGAGVQDRAIHSLIIAAAIGILPGWARDELRLRNLGPVEPTVISPLARAFCGALRWALPPKPS